MASSHSQELIPSQRNSGAQTLHKERLAGFDLARAFAYFGMVIVNFRMAMVSPSVSHTEPVSPVMNFLEGKAAALFVILAGVGLSLLAGRASGGETESATRISLLKRALLLFLLGTLWTPLWPGDILRNYGVFLSVGAFFLGSSWKILAPMSLLPAVIFCGLFLTLDFNAGWNWLDISYTDFWTLPGFFRSLFFQRFQSRFSLDRLYLLRHVAGRMELEGCDVSQAHRRCRTSALCTDGDHFSQISCDFI